MLDFTAVAHGQSNKSARRREKYANQFKEILHPDLHLLLRHEEMPWWKKTQVTQSHMQLPPQVSITCTYCSHAAKTHQYMHGHAYRRKCGIPLTDFFFSTLRDF